MVKKLPKEVQGEFLDLAREIPQAETPAQVQAHFASMLALDPEKLRGFVRWWNRPSPLSMLTWANRDGVDVDPYEAWDSVATDEKRALVKKQTDEWVEQNSNAVESTHREAKYEGTLTPMGAVKAALTFDQRTAFRLIMARDYGRTLDSKKRDQPARDKNEETRRKRRRKFAPIQKSSTATTQRQQKV